MSKEAYTFENENGKTAYLAGVIDTLSDEYLVKVCPKYSTVEADLFELEDYGDFNKAIANRLKKYLPSIGGNIDAVAKNIDKMEIVFEEDVDFQSFQAPGFVMSMYERIPDYVHSREAHDSFASFCESVEYYLGSPIRFYRAKKGYEVLSKFYIGMIFETIFIEYEGYLLMLCRGTSE